MVVIGDNKPFLDRFLPCLREMSERRGELLIRIPPHPDAMSQALSVTKTLYEMDSRTGVSVSNGRRRRQMLNGFKKNIFVIVDPSISYTNNFIDNGFFSPLIFARSNSFQGKISVKVVEGLRERRNHIDAVFESGGVYPDSLDRVDIIFKYMGGSMRVPSMMNGRACIHTPLNPKSPDESRQMYVASRRSLHNIRDHARKPSTMYDPIFWEAWGEYYIEAIRILSGERSSKVLKSSSGIKYKRRMDHIKKAKYPLLGLMRHLMEGGDIKDYAERFNCPHDQLNRFLGPFLSYLEHLSIPLRNGDGYESNFHRSAVEGICHSYNKYASRRGCATMSPKEFASVGWGKHLFT